MRIFFLVAYDISDNKRRAKLARLMESLGARVQGSVFEIYLTPKEAKQMVIKAKKVINEKKIACESTLCVIPVERKSKYMGKEIPRSHPKS